MAKRKKLPPGKVNIHEAKTHLSALLQRVAGGEEVIIANRGEPVAKIVPVKSSRKSASFLGIDRDRLTVPADFNAPLPPDVLAAFWGGEVPPRNTRK